MKALIKLLFSLARGEGVKLAPSSKAMKVAEEVAKNVGDGVHPVSNRTIAIGEPLYPLTISIDCAQFDASLRVAESKYSIEIKHRKGEEAFREDALFCVSFKNKDRTMFTMERVAVVTKELGVPVYRQGFLDDETVAKFLLCDPVRAVLAKIDFAPLTRLFLNPIQLTVSSKLKDPVACAAQVRVFMELMEALACARKLEEPQPKGKR